MRGNRRSASTEEPGLLYNIASLVIRRGVTGRNTGVFLVNRQAIHHMFLTKTGVAALYAPKRASYLTSGRFF